MQRRLEEFNALGAKLVAISPESPDNTLTMREKHDLAFAVLSDHGNQVARQFGLVLTVDGKQWEKFLELGLDLARHNGSGNWEIPVPATFVLDSEGIVRFAFVDADYTRRAEPDEILECLRGL